MTAVITRAAKQEIQSAGFSFTPADLAVSSIFSGGANKTQAGQFTGM
jgi:hypothetical protein